LLENKGSGASACVTYRGGGTYNCLVRVRRAAACKVHGHGGAKTATYYYIIITMAVCECINTLSHIMNAPPPQRVVQHATAYRL